MISLKQFSAAMLSANSIQLSDIQLSLKLGDNYVKKIHEFILSNFTVYDFSCTDNGIIQKISLVTDTNNVIIEFENNPISKNHLTVISGNNKISKTYSTYSEFKKMLEKIKTELIEKL